MVGSAASPGESSHMIRLLPGWLDEAQKLQFGHGPDETGAREQAEENLITAQSSYQYIRKALLVNKVA